jgi:hypothetical protein
MAKLSAELEAQINRAMTNARDYRDDEIAVSARYVPSTDLLLLILKTGHRIAIPREDLQGLAGEKRSAVANVQVIASGSALHWPQLDVDFSVHGLAEGRYGNDKWMKILRQRGHSAKRTSTKKIGQKAPIKSNVERLVAAGVIHPDHVAKHNYKAINKLSTAEVNTLIKLRSKLGVQDASDGYLSRSFPGRYNVRKSGRHEQATV